MRAMIEAWVARLMACCRSLWALSTENKISLAAGFIAIIALGVSIHQGYETRRHNRLSVRPIMASKTTYEPGEDQGLFLENVGFGPAVVTKIELFVKGYRIHGDSPKEIWTKAIRHLKDLAPGLQAQEAAFVRWFNVGMSIKPGESNSLFVVRGESANPETSEAIQEAVELIGLKIRYKSLYDETFTFAVGNVTVNAEEQRELTDQ